MPLRRLFHTPLPLGTFLRNSRSVSSWLHLLRMMFFALRVLDQSPRYFLMRLCRRLYTASQLMMPPHNYRSRSSSWCILSNDPSDRQASPSAHCNAGSASPPQPADIATLCSPSSASHASDGHEHTTAPRVLLQSPPGLEKYACQHASQENLLKRHRCVLVCVLLSQSHSHSHMSVPPKWEHIVCAQLLPTREVQVLPLREPTILLVQILVQELVLFLNQKPWFFPVVKFGQSMPDGLGHIDTADSDLSCIISTVSRFFSGIQAQLAETPPQRLADGFMRLSFKKQTIITFTSPISSLRTLATRTSLSCSTRTPSSPTLWFSPSRKTPQAKVRWAWVCSSFEHCCAALLFVAKKRDASTDLLRRSRGHTKQHNVDFIGGDFNMSAFSTVGDVFSDPEFLAPGNSFLWGFGALEEQYRWCTGFLIMPKRPYDWRVDTHGCYKYDNVALAFGPRDQTAHLPVFLPPSHHRPAWPRQHHAQ